MSTSRSGPRYRRLRCNQCQILAINGVVCHEVGCPNWWKGKTGECFACGENYRLTEAYHPTGKGYCKSCRRLYR